MNNDNTSQTNDVWSDWLLHHRHGGDSDVANSIHVQTVKYADRVLDGAQITAGMTLLDVGTGDGLVAFQAISRIGPSLNVILTDISGAMLKHAENLACDRGIRNQCVFHECAAENFEIIESESVDAVVMRAVLAYVPNKAAALSECFRVLKPGGCLSICEPILRDEALMVHALQTLLNAQSPELRDRMLGLECRIRAAQFPDTIEKISQNPTTNFTERDLFQLALNSGFNEVHMEFHIDTNRKGMTNWAAFLESSPHPLAPPINQILAEQFTNDDRQYFTSKFRPIVEAGHSVGIDRNAYLTARKPKLSR